MIKKSGRIFLILAMSLFLLNNTAAQDSGSIYEGLLIAPGNGLDVAVYSFSKDIDIQKTVKDLVVGHSNNSLELLFSKDGASVFSFDSAPYGYYPATLSINQDFSEFTAPVTEHFLVHFKGKILIPGGYFAMRFQKADDKAFVYITDPYNKSGVQDIEPFNYSGDFLGGFYFQNDFPHFVNNKKLNIEYFPREEIYDIDIILVQKEGDFALELEAVMGLSLEKILLSSDKERIQDLTDLDLKVHLFMGGQWKPFSSYRGNLYPKDFYPEDYRQLEQENFDRQIEDQENENTIYMCPEDPNQGFKGEIVKLTGIMEDFSKEQKLIEDKERKRTSVRPAARLTDYETRNYWENPCPACPFDKYILKAIEEADHKIATGQVLSLGGIGFDSDEGYFESNDFAFRTLGNYSLDLSTKDPGQLISSMKLFDLFKKSFDWYVQSSEGEAAAQKREINDQVIKILGINPFTPQIADPKEKAKQIGKSFKDYLGRNLFMTVTKLSGNLLLPTGELSMNCEEGQGAIVAFVNRSKSSFKDLEDIKSSSLISYFQNSTGNSKTIGSFKMKEPGVVSVEIYIFHYAGYLDAKISLAIDDRGYLDLKDLKPFMSK